MEWVAFKTVVVSESVVNRQEKNSDSRETSKSEVERLACG